MYLLKCVLVGGCLLDFLKVSEAPPNTCLRASERSHYYFGTDTFLSQLSEQDLSTSSWILPSPRHWFLISHHPLSLSFRRLLIPFSDSFWTPGPCDVFPLESALISGHCYTCDLRNFLPVLALWASTAGEPPQLMSLSDWLVIARRLHSKLCSLGIQELSSGGIFSHQSHFLLHTPAAMWPPPILILSNFLKFGLC